MLDHLLRKSRMAIGAVRWRWRAPLEYDLTSTMGPTTARIIGPATIDSDTWKQGENNK